MMPRFVVLIHDHPQLHWDFMLESTGVLRTWRLDHEPHLPTAITAMPLPDHRLFYLEYEGPVSGDRGRVQRWDQGTYELLDATPERLTVALHGTRLNGQATLEMATDNACRFRYVAEPSSHG